MKLTLFIASFVLLTMANAPHAQALSVESRNSQNSDGTQKFADPDEQMPAFLVSPGSVNSGEVGFVSGANAVVIPQSVSNTLRARELNSTSSQFNKTNNNNQ
jgi:hypothetical protein